MGKHQQNVHSTLHQDHNQTQNDFIAVASEARATLVALALQNPVRSPALPVEAHGLQTYGGPAGNHLEHGAHRFDGWVGRIAEPMSDREPYWVIATSQTWPDASSQVRAFSGKSMPIV
jgi:hypothetical protein